MDNSLTTITANYKNDDEIAADLQLNLDNVLEFNKMSDYTFIHSELCGDPNIGHSATQCWDFINRYDDLLVKGLEDKIKEMNKFIMAVNIHRAIMDDNNTQQKSKRDRNCCFPIYGSQNGKISKETN